jgi:SAM-dependent methyltransferase
MNLNNYENRISLFLDWISDTLPTGGILLDIGASDGMFCPEVASLRGCGYTIDGVDPDVSALERNGLLRNRYPGRIESAPLPATAYDAAFAIYVAEHVEEPDRFLAAAARALRPGGSLFLITPNGDHYFARMAKLLQSTRLQERVLRLIRPGELVDRYHHAALYRMNRPAKLASLARELGFDRVEFRFSERFEELACYFPGPTKLLPRAWELFVERTGKEHLLGNLMARMVKKSEG